MEFKDFLAGKSVFDDRQESELVGAKKRIKNVLMNYLFTGTITLSRREIEVYRLIHQEHLTHSQVAERLKISRQSSRNFLFKANKKIKKVIQLFEES
ncbi:MAG: hypothetical protein ACLSVP_00715 [Fusobacterium sp.]